MKSLTTIVFLFLASGVSAQSPRPLPGPIQAAADRLKDGGATHRQAYRREEAQGTIVLLWDEGTLKHLALYRLRQSPTDRIRWPFGSQRQPSDIVFQTPKSSTQP